jgi:hypothetical protein
MSEEMPPTGGEHNQETVQTLDEMQQLIGSCKGN